MLGYSFAIGTNPSHDIRRSCTDLIIYSRIPSISFHFNNFGVPLVECISTTFYFKFVYSRSDNFRSRRTIFIQSLTESNIVNRIKECNNVTLFVAFRVSRYIFHITRYNIRTSLRNPLIKVIVTLFIFLITRIPEVVQINYRIILILEIRIQKSIFVESDCIHTRSISEQSPIGHITLHITDIHRICSRIHPASKRIGIHFCRSPFRYRRYRNICRRGSISVFRWRAQLRAIVIFELDRIFTSLLGVSRRVSNITRYLAYCRSPITAEFIGICSSRFLSRRRTLIFRCSTCYIVFFIAQLGSIFIYPSYNELILFNILCLIFCRPSHIVKAKRTFTTFDYQFPANKLEARFIRSAWRHNSRCLCHIRIFQRPNRRIIIANECNGILSRCRCVRSLISCRSGNLIKANLTI